ncbi:MAG: site-2 protease family protein [Acidobacteriota bacterium]|nr:site-2 protease family protein [Acidobacteriota bacterium]
MTDSQFDPERHLTADLEQLFARGALEPALSERMVYLPPPKGKAAGKFRDRTWLVVLLFLATMFLTTAVGASQYAAFASNFLNVPIAVNWALVVRGLWYSVTILAILGAHEFGHYFACRYYDVDASLPYFLPAPLPLTGTLGAFIRIREPIPSKRMLFDIGIAGPIAGFIVAVPALFLGISMSRVIPLPPDFQGLQLGEPLLFKAAEWLIWGSIPHGWSLNLHPVGFAAWFGMLATALNLFPIGQLDGGHVTYAVLGRRSTYITIAMMAVTVGLTFLSLSWAAWTVLLAIMLFSFGLRHPRTLDEHVPLDRKRLWLALFALIMFVLCFTPTPIEPMQLLGR